MAKVATRVAYGDALKELMVENKNVVVLDADLAGSTKSGEAKKVDPSRHFDMGIAEGNMMSVAAGLAASGKIGMHLLSQCLRLDVDLNKFVTVSDIHN